MPSTLPAGTLNVTSSTAITCLRREQPGAHAENAAQVRAPRSRRSCGHAARRVRRREPAEIVVRRRRPAGAGSSCAQVASACAQRARNAQPAKPGGIAAPRRGSCRAAGRAAPCPAPARRTAARACRDAAARRTAPPSARSRPPRPAYITETRSATRATMPRSWVISRIARPKLALERCEQPQDLRLHGDVERGGRLVGDQQLRLAHQRHGDHHALAQPAGELVRKLAEPHVRRGDADAAQQLGRAVERGGARGALVAASAPRPSASRP